MARKNMRFRNSLIALSGAVFLLPLTSSITQAQNGVRPPLIITTAPLPDSIKSKIYTKPVPVREITPSQIVSRDYFAPTETEITHRVNGLHNELYDLQVEISEVATSLQSLQKNNETRASEYYAAVATINAQLQSGTTPGNPRLLQKLNVAESSLDTLSTSVTQLNRIAVAASKIASGASFLLESSRAAYSLSGAVEEDHIKLAELEDAINSTFVTIDRVLNNVNDDITRTASYLSAENHNLRTLSLAVTNGDFYGKSLSSRPFSNAALFNGEGGEGLTASTSSSQRNAPLSGPRPLAKIRFDRQNVDYEEPVYMAISKALERYPNARFDLVAIHPSTGNAAEIAIESTRARRNAEHVLRTLTQMGLPIERIDLSYSDSAEATTNEVHLYIR